MGFQETSEADPARRVFVSYIDKSREYYLAQGFGNPYRWAYNRETPFTRPGKPLSECRVAPVPPPRHLVVVGGETRRKSQNFVR